MLLSPMVQTRFLVNLCRPMGFSHHHHPVFVMNARMGVNTVSKSRNSCKMKSESYRPSEVFFDVDLDTF